MSISSLIQSCVIFIHLQFKKVLLFTPALLQNLYAPHKCYILVLVFYIGFSVLFRWQKQITMHKQVTMYKACHSHCTTDAAISYIKIKHGFHTGFLRHGNHVILCCHYRYNKHQFRISRVRRELPVQPGQPVQAQTVQPEHIS